jgi:hypothetical protein
MKSAWKMGSVLLLFVAAACERTSSDGLSIEGNVKPVTTAPSEKLLREDITDTKALVAMLDSIVKDAPPAKFGDTTWEARRRFVEAERIKRLGKGAHLLVISCEAKEGPDGHLAYTSSDKNLRVNFYMKVPAGEEQAEKVLDLLDRFEKALLADQKFIISTGHSALEGYDSQRANEELFGELRETGLIMTTITLGDGTLMAVSNSPLGMPHMKLSTAISQAEIAHLDFQINLIRNRTPDIAAFVEPLQAEKKRWRGYPFSYVEEPFWRTSQLYDGDPARVCLIGRFEETDLTSGGLEVYAFTNATAKLVGKATDWYLVNKDDLSIIAHGKAPKSNYA